MCRRLERAGVIPAYYAEPGERGGDAAVGVSKLPVCIPLLMALSGSEDFEDDGFQLDLADSDFIRKWNHRMKDSDVQ